MSAYTVAITNYVTANFPTPSYAVTAQTALIAMGEVFAASVVPTSSAQERTIFIMETIEANSNFGLVAKETEFYEELLEFGEFCVNLAIVANTPGFTGAQMLYMKMLQAGVAPPNLTVSSNQFSEAPSAGYNAVGDYDLNWATITPFTTASKVMIQLDSVPVGNYAEAYVTAPNQITINTYILGVAAAPGNVAGTAADGVLVDVGILIVVFP